MSASSNTFLFLLNRKWLFIGLAIGILFILLPHPTGLSANGWRAAGLAIAAIIWFVKRPVRPPTIALLIIVGHIIFNVSSPEEVAQAFFNDSVFFIMGVLMLGVAVVKQGLDRAFARKMLLFSGESFPKFIISTVLFSTLLTSLFGEYAAAALLLPFTMTLISEETNLSARRKRAKILLIALAFGCIVGGAGAPSGGARNVIIMQYLQEQCQFTMNYAGWIKYSAPVVLLSALMLIILLIHSSVLEKDCKSNLNISSSKQEWKKPLSNDDKLAVLIVLITLSLWLFYSSRLGMGIIALFGASLFLILGLLKWEVFNKNVNWGVVILYSAVVMLGNSLYEKGTADWIADRITGLTGGAELVAILLPLAIALFIPIAANYMGAVGAVAIFAPVILILASRANMDIASIGLFTAISSSFAYMTFHASPAGTIVHTTGFLEPKDFKSTGWKMTGTSVIILLLAQKFIWSFY